jgi:hypothetical protein
MLGTLRELKKSEEGQTLVLAAVFGLVLMLCVLGTVNLGRAVYDKVQLQAAADGAAYSQAAVEARVFNFTAYTNRAMVVHYASLMAATSYLTYVHFEWVFIKALFDVLKNLPYVGPAFGVVQAVFQALVRFLDIAVAALSPLLTAANIVLYALQEGAWWSVYLGRLARQTPPEAHSGDSAAHPYLPIWPNLIPLANQAVFSQTRGHLTMPQNSVETLQILLNSRSDAVQAARLHMLEIANSARQPWVAYGDRYANPSLSPFARHFTYRLLGSKLQYGNHARTEMGAFPPQGGIGGGLKSQAQVWSGQQNALSYDFRFLRIRFKNTIPLFTFVGMDQVAPSVSPFNNSYFRVWRPSGLLGRALLWLFAPLKGLLKGIESYANQTRPNPDYRLFTLSPYVYFAPHASNKPGLGPTGALGNFAQPDVLVGLAKEGRDYNQEQGASKYHGRRFSWNGRGAGSGAVDFSYTDKDWPQIAGMPRNLQVLHKGLNAFAAAQVYYHRPGDWKEQPNFFNPLWGARLIPVAESNVAAKLGFTAVPLIKQFLLH